MQLPMSQWVLTIALVAGCAAPPAPSQVWTPSAQDLRICEAMAQDFTTPSVRARFMRECLAVPPGGGYGYAAGSPSVSGLSLLNDGPGTDNGPYGPMGPTWQQFNAPFQNAVPPQLQPYQILPSPHPQTRPYQPPY